MQKATPFPKKSTLVKQPRKKESSTKPQQFNYIKMTAAIVVGNGIVLTGLFFIFLNYLRMITFYD